MAGTVFLLLCLIVGNLIGAGILALPINTGLSGLWPSLVGMLVIGAAMFFSAWVLSREAVEARLDTFNFPSLYRRYMGRTGMWVAVGANLLILYGLLTAYLTGAAKILGDLFHEPASKQGWLLLGFFAVATAFVLVRNRWILTAVAGLVIVKVAMFIGMTGIAEQYVVPGRASYMDWAYLPATSAIILTSFHFHNIIPNVCKEMQWNFSRVWKTILAGMLIGYAMNAIWIQIGVGVLPMDASPNGLLTAFQQNLPATVPMSHLIPSRVFVTASVVFSLAALMTAYMSNGLGLRGFLKDMLVNQCRVDVRGLDAVLAFGPPLLVALLYPNIFLKAIDLVGGVGIVILFGILPAVVFIKRAGSASRRIFGWAMLALFTACFAIEVGQELGLLKLRPEVEYWNTPAARSEHQPYAPR